MNYHTLTHQQLDGIARDVITAQDQREALGAINEMRRREAVISGA